MRSILAALALLAALVAPRAEAQIVNQQTGTSYTFSNTDCSKLVVFNNAGSIAAALPHADSASGGGSGFFLPPCRIEVIDFGAGSVTITPVGSTIGGTSSLTLTTGQSSVITSDGTNYEVQPGAAVGGGSVPTGVNGVFVTNGAGTPSISSTLPANLTIPTATLTGTFNGWGANSLGVSYSIAGTPTTAGTGYAAGDTVTIAGGTGTSPAILTVITVGGGGNITTFAVQKQGVYTALPASPAAQASTSGSGTGATFTLVPEPLIRFSSIASTTLNNQLLGTGMPSLLTSNEIVAYGPYACGGQSVNSETTCVGFMAGGKADSANSAYFGGAAVALLNASLSQQNAVGGNDGLRLATQASFMALWGTASCYHCQAGVGQMTGIGTGVFGNTVTAQNNNLSTGAGYSACAGAVGGVFAGVSCFGSNTGGALNGAFGSTLIGIGVGNTTFVSGHGVLLIGSGQFTVDTPAAGTNNYTNIESILTITGTNTPSTSVANFAGGLTVGAPTGSAPATGFINAQGFEINGVALSGNYASTYGVAGNSSQTVASAGTGNVAGDVLTLTDGCTVHGKLAIVSVSGGSPTRYTVINPGACTTPPPNPVSATGGTGTPATFTLTYGTTASNLLYETGTLANLFLTGDVDPGFAGAGDVFVGPLAGAKLSGLTYNNTVVGLQGCGGGAASTFAGGSMSCVGYRAAYRITGTSVSAIDVHGATALSSQTFATSQVAAFGTNSLLNENYNGLLARVSAFGYSACSGAASTAAFHLGSCFGALTGGALTTATNFTLIGINAGNVTFASGTNVVILCSGSIACDTPAAGTSNYMNFNNIWTATGTDVLATSVSNFTGSLTLGTSGTSAGTLSFNNATSGTVKLTPPTGALGSAVLTLPAVTDTVAVLGNLALSGTTGSIGGSALLAGACTSGTVAITNSTTAMVAEASPVTYPGDGFDWAAYVSAAGTVTVKVCGFVAGTPTASNYNVRVLQ